MPGPVGGYTTVPVAALPAAVRRLSVGELAGHANISRDAAERFLRGGQCQTKTVRKICEEFGLTLESLTRGQPDPHGVAPESVGQEWLIDGIPTPHNTAANGLQYRVYPLRHRYLPGRRGRGKKYDIAHVSPEVRADWLPKLRRHAEVCGRVRHPRLPALHGYFPADGTGAVWWVVDEWVPGRCLAEVLATDDLSAAAPAYARQLADGLSALHAAGVVRRDLSPDTVWVGDAELLLTEFELAKLGQGTPTVSKTWPHNPYRAPEVHAGDAEPTADVYSWARVVTALLLKDLPPAAELAAALGKLPLPRDVRGVLVAASAARPSQRPRTVSAFLSTVEAWARGTDS